MMKATKARQRIPGGIGKEYRVLLHLSSMGYLCIRSIRSEGPFDLVAMKFRPLKILLIQVTSLPLTFVKSPLKSAGFKEFTEHATGSVSVQIWALPKSSDHCVIHTWQDGKKQRRRFLPLVDFLASPKLYSKSDRTIHAARASREVFMAIVRKEKP